MVTITKKKTTAAGNSAAQSAAASSASSDNSAANTGRVTITKRPVVVSKSTAPASASTAITGNKTGSAYAPRSTSQWREVGGGRVSTKPAAQTSGTEKTFWYNDRNTPNFDPAKANTTGHNRIWNTLKSGVLSELSNQANNIGVGYDARGGSTMASQVYKDQALMLQQQVDAARAGLSDPNLSAMDRVDMERALKDSEDQLSTIQKSMGAEKQVAPAMYHASDTAASKAETAKQAASSGLGKVGRAAVDVGAGLTQLAVQAGANKIIPGLGTAARATSLSGLYSRQYRQNAGAQYDPNKAALAGTIAGAGVVAGRALSGAVSAAGLNVLRAMGKQNAVLPNILSGGVSSMAYALGESGAGETSNYATYEGYKTDPKAFAENMAWAFAFGAIDRTIKTAAMTVQNKAYVQQLNSEVGERYGIVQKIINGGTAEQKAQGASSVMDGVEKLRAALNDMQFIGAQKQVDSINQFLNSIDAEMAQYIPVTTETPTAAQGSLAAAPVSAPAAPEPSTGEIIPEVGKPAVMPPRAVPEFTPEDYANIEAEPSRDFAEATEPQDTIPVNDNPAALVPVANTLGQSGKKAMLAFYDGDVDTDLYAKDFVTAYNAGLNGKARPTENYISVGKAVAAYTAGQNDAKAKASAAAPSKEMTLDEAMSAFNDGGIINHAKVSEDVENGTFPVLQESSLPSEKQGSTIKEKKPTQSSDVPQQQIADQLGKYITSGKNFTAARLFEIADKAYGGTMAQGTYTVKDAYDGMELAVNQSLMRSEKVKAANDSTDGAVKMIRSLDNVLSHLPTQSKRTEEMEKFQQFSTPPTIAYTAAWCAGITNKDVALEPSAGVGGIALWPKAWGAKVYANELSERRLAFLNRLGLDGTFNLNAEQIDNMLPENIKPTVVLMNPPFSSTAGRTASNKTSNAERHIEQALNRLEDGGRLVAVLGRGMSDDAPAFRKWWGDIKAKYNVRANIRIDGSNYHKYGTDFDIQLVVIDKNGPTKNTLTGEYKDLTEIPKVMEGIRNDRTRISGADHPAAAGLFSDGVLGTGLHSGIPAVSEQGSGRGLRSSGDKDGRGVGSGAVSGRGNRRGAGGLRRPGDTGRIAKEVSSSGTGGTVQRGGSQGHSRGLDGRSSVKLQSNGNDLIKSEVSLEKAKAADIRSIQEDPDNVYSLYVPKKAYIKGAKKHPAKLVESAAMSAVDPPDVTYTPNLPQKLITSGALSDAQLENIIYAGQAHEQMLPNGQRKGYFIGDGTGVGKGRQIAGIILDNFRQGRKKAVWISEKSDLIEDAKRDWTDLGGNKDDVISFSKVKFGKSITADTGILFSSYDTLKYEKGTDSRLAAIEKWLGRDFDGVIVLDEAHNMGNAIPVKGKRGKKKPSKKALAGIKLQEAFPNARVVYASATGATDISQYAYLERLGLWGKGTAFNDVRDFISKISDGGLAAMELVARDMKAMGVYMARSISYDNVKYNTLQHNLSPMQTEIYNTMSRAWQKVFQNIGEALKTTSADKNKDARTSAVGQFYSSQQRFYNQVLTSMSVPTMVEDVKKELAAGHSCVIQLTNTNEASADRAIAEAEDTGTDLDDMDMTPSECLINYLEKSFPVQAYEEYTDDKGNTLSRPVTDKDGKAVLDRQAVRQRDALISDVKQMKVPDGPLELLFDAFGTDAVAERTGRTRRVVEKPDENGQLHRVVEVRSSNSGLADTKMFQDGKKRILVFSEAGGTGASYHADLRAKNQQQRIHYLLQAGWNAAKAVQGFGRTHRSNEASAPVYKLVTTNIMGQKRFTSTIARRLDQLGALTKGQRQTGSGMFGEKDNLENPIAQDALERYYKTMPVESVKKLGLYEKLYDQFGTYKPDQETARDIGRFLNRILALEVDEQNRVFQGFYDTFDRMMDAAIASGSVDMGLENYAADKIDVLDEKVIRTDPSGADTKYVQMTAYKKPETLSYQGAITRPGFQGFVKLSDGAVRAVYPISAKTNAKGEVEERYKLQSPETEKYSTYVQSTMDKETTTIPKSEWKSAWEAETKKLPEYNETRLHLLTGTLLPIWDRLPTSNTRVMRIIASDGKQYLGRLIRATDIDSVLRGLGTARTQETYTPEQISKKVMDEGKTVVLRDNKTRIVRRRVSGENRMEILGNNVWYIAQQYHGIISERINYEYRYFIPTGEQGANILAELMKSNPVVDIRDAAPSSVDHMVAAESPEQKWSAQRVGDSDKAPMPVSDIVEKIRHDFGINITTGHVRGAGITGQYDRGSQGIRSRIVNDLPTVSHELGHHLDNLYGLTKELPEAARRELIDGLDADMKAAYKEKKWLTEGLAEYTRKYLQNRETAAIDYPEFTKHFKNSLNAKDNALIDQLADEVNAYYSMDAETAGSSIRNREDRGRDFRTWDQRVAEKGDAFYQAWVDSNHGIRLFDRATGSHTYKLASNAAYADAMAGSILTGDLTGPEGQYVASGLTTALHGIDLKNKTEYRDFGEYLVVKHGPERLKEGMRIFADDRKNSTAWMEDRAQALEQQYPEFKAAAARLYQFQTDFLQTWGVGTGLVSAQSAKSWAERWKYYVPLNRFMGDRGAGGARRGFANQNSTIRKAYGSGRDIVNPVDNIINNVVRMVNAATRNNVAVQITKVAQSKGGMADFLEKVPAPLKQKTFDAAALKGKLSDALDEGMMQGTIHADDASFAQDIIDGIDDLLIQYGRGVAHGDVVTVLRNGKPEYWKINDPMLLSSLTSMDTAKLPAWLETYGAMSRFITSNITGNNVIWSIFSNFPRDLMTYFTFSQDKNPVHMMGGIAAAYANRLKGKNADPLYKEYLAMGGGKVSAYSADRDLAKNIRAKLIGGKAQWLNPVEWICFVSDTVEMGPRYSYYKICREKLGMTPQEAFYESCDITVNFRRGGVQARTLNKVIPFFNAGVQGMDKYVRWQTCEEIPYSITSKERSKAIRSRMVAYLAASAALAALFYGMNARTQEDRDNYAQLSNYTKNNYWCIPLGGGKYLTIPKPREIAVPSSLMEAAAEKYLNGNPHAMDEFYGYAADTCLPNVASDLAQADIGGAIGNLGVLGTGVRMFANKDFLGKPIVSSGMQNLEPKDQYNNRTSKLAKAVGDAFNVSPMMTDYFFSNTLGGWWKYQKALFPVGSENVDLTLGVQGSYVRDNQYSTDLVNWLYDQAEASNTRRNSNPEDLAAAIQYKRDSSMTSFYSNFNKLSKSAPETESRRGTRQAVLSMVTEYRKDFDNGTRTEAEAAVEAVCEAADSTEYLPAVMPVTVKDANGEAHTLSDSQYLEYQTEYLGFYWDTVERTLEGAGNQQSKESVLAAAKSVAKDNATRRLFSRMGIKNKPDEYKGIGGSTLTQFKAGIDKANDDGSLTQEEVISIIDNLHGLNDTQRSTLFHSHYESDKNNPWA